MATLSQAKTLGGVGSILIFIPFVSIVGYILIIVAVKDISDDLQDKSIFRNVVIAAATGIVGAIAGGCRDRLRGGHGNPDRGHLGVPRGVRRDSS